MNMSDAFSEPQASENRLQVASRLFRAYHSRCFWHSPPDLQITIDLVPFVVKGLRENGGRAGFLEAMALEQKSSHEPGLAQGPEQCR